MNQTYNLNEIKRENRSEPSREDKYTSTDKCVLRSYIGIQLFIVVAVLLYVYISFTYRFTNKSTN